MTFREKFSLLYRIGGKTRQEIADAAEVSPATVGNWIDGIGSGPRLSEAVAIADLFGVPLDYLARDDVDLSDEELARRLREGARGEKGQVHLIEDPAVEKRPPKKGRRRPK